MSPHSPRRDSGLTDSNASESTSFVSRKGCVIRSAGNQYRDCKGAGAAGVLSSP